MASYLARLEVPVAAVGSWHLHLISLVTHVTVTTRDSTAEPMTLKQNQP